MQNETINNIKEQLIGTKGYFIVKVPKSKYLVLCKCIASSWSVDLLNPNNDTVERIKDSVEKDKLGVFLDNLLNINPKKINKEELGKL